MQYDAIIIGAGVAGLSSALKLSGQGKKILLLERQPVPGGYAASFQRKGFIFESSIHCVDALGKGGEIRNFLEETGIDKNIDFIELDSFARVIYPGHDFLLDFNQGNFINFLKEKFPLEKGNLKRLFYAFDKFYEQFERYTEIPELIRPLIGTFACPHFLKASTRTVKQFIDGYIKDEKLKAMLTDIWRFMGLAPGRLSASYFLLVFEGYYYNPTAYIKGGFSRLFKAMVEQIEKNGSEVRFNTTVTKIITGQKRAVQLVLTDKNEEFQAPAIISNASAIDTLTVLLDDDLLKKKYLKKLSGLEKSISAVQLYLGLSLPAKSLGMNHRMFSINTTYDHDENFKYSLRGDYDRCSLELVDHSRIDPSLVPEGKGSLLIMTLDSYSNWENLREDEYRIKKQEVTSKLISRVEKYLPGLSKHVEVMELATPRTMKRYTLSPDGAIYGFAQTVKQSGQNRLSQQTKIRGLFLAGGWTFPGPGVHGCFLSGIFAADLVSRFLAKIRSRPT